MPRSRFATSLNLFITLAAAALASGGFAFAADAPGSTPAPAAGNTTAAPAAAVAAPVPPSKDALAAYFGNWPDGASPNDIGKRVAENFLARQFRFQTGRYANQPNASVIYPEVIAWYGALTFAEATKDTDLENKLIQKFGILSSPEGAAHIASTQTVDFHVFGAVPLEIYLLTKSQGYLDLGKSFADRQIANVFRPDGYSSEARFWVDDLYMLPLVQVQAYRATHDATYLDHTAQLFSDYVDKLQQPNGLFQHGTDAPYYWSRGDGWVAAGFTELFRDLPTTNPHYAHLMDSYHKMMAGLLKYQGDDGLWKQLIDHPEGWTETSGSAMFAFAFVAGVKNGWLDAPTYGPAARKAWLGLVAKIDQNANMSGVCPGTGKWTSSSGTDGVQYYLSRQPLSGDALNTYDELHGLAPVLWTATALVR